MLRLARFAFLAGIAAAIPGITVALDPPARPSQQQNKQPTRDDGKKAEPAKKDSASKDTVERIDRRNSRMRERDHAIDRMLNQQKK
jgi:hypothetical protein